MKDMEKEKWTDDVLNSLTGIRQAEPNPFLLTRIEGRLQAKTGMSKFQVRLAAVGLGILLLSNVWLALTYDSSKLQQANSLTTSYQI